MTTKKLCYRIGRRHGSYAAGDEVLLTEDEAIQLENEAPGVIVGIVKAEEVSKIEPSDSVAERVLFKEPA